MNYIGKWVFHSIGTFGDEGIEYLTAEEYINSPMPYVDESDPDAVADELKERRGMAKSELRVLDDGKLFILLPIPEGVSDEEVTAAVATGEITLYDGMLTDKPMLWEERDGEFWYNTGIEGEVFDEAADPWVRAIDEDGYFNLMNTRYAKAE